jgi:glycosyltransferase involved in cell wall biosynthesis
MGINATITCDLSKPNPRDFVECLATHPNINLSIISNSEEYPELENIDENQIKYYSPPYSPTLYPFIPTAKTQLSKILDDFDTDILLSMGVGPLIFTGLATNFSPTILVPQGAETAMATNQFYFTDKTKYKLILRYVYQPMFSRLLNHVSEVWGITEGNQSNYTELGLNKNKFRAFDWVPVNTDRFTPTGKTASFNTEPDDVIIGTFRRLRGELVLDSCLPFLDAIEILSQKCDNFHVVFGSFYHNKKDIYGKINKKIKQISAKNYITKQEMVPKEDMPAYYRGVDIYFNLTFPKNPLGALGTGPKEAMASGSLLATPNNPSSGPAEYAINHRSNGILTSLDPVDIAEQLEYAISDDQRREQIADEGRNMVIEEFSNESISEYAYQYMMELLN